MTAFVAADRPTHRSVALAAARRALPARLVAVAIAGFVALAAVADDDGPVLCPFRRCTGGYCPACGLTRSGGRLLRGDLTGSWRHHPFLLLAVIQAGVVAATWSLAPPGARRWLTGLVRPALVVNGVAVAAIWLVRLAAGSIPVPFAG